MDTTQTSDQLFFTEWNRYKKLVENNGLFHTEMYAAFNHLLDQKFTNRDLSILDLGCGDSAYIAKSLTQRSISNYVGVDLSDIAMGLAQNNLPKTINKIEFVHSDFIEAMGIMVKDAKKFDIVFTSYALHHYSTDKKQLFFNLAAQLLNDHGVAVVIDVICKDNETLQEFYSRTINFYATFKMITEKDLDAYYQHISGSDLPETLETYTKLALNAGFTKFENLDQKEQLFQISVGSK